MKLTFVWVGKTKNAALRNLIEEYRNRVNRFAHVEVIEIREPSALKDTRKLIEKEGEAILSRLVDRAFVVALDEHGREMTSFELADFIERHRQTGSKELTWVIGGFAGLAAAVKHRANLTLALSRLTLPHELARAVLLEQVYRAHTILHDLPYQK